MYNVSFVCIHFYSHYILSCQLSIGTMKMLTRLPDSARSMSYFSVFVSGICMKGELKPCETSALDPSVCPKTGVGKQAPKSLDHQRASITLLLVEILPSRELFVPTSAF